MYIYETLERSPSPDVLIKQADIFHMTADHLPGFTYRKMLDVSDLSDDDVRLLLLTIETLRKKNEK